MVDVKMGVLGCGGRMGRMLLATIAVQEGAVIAGGVDRPDSPVIGRDLGELAGVGVLGLTATSDKAALFAAADVVIDFTLPEATAEHAALAGDSGTALLVGVLRILLGWSLPLMIICGYATVIAMTVVAPPEIVGIAYDSGGVTTSTVTVPLVTALGVGMASSLRDRNPMTDGFGLIAFASLTPMIFVMAYGSIIAWI